MRAVSKHETHSLRWRGEATGGVLVPGGAEVVVEVPGVVEPPPVPQPITWRFAYTIERRSTWWMGGKKGEWAEAIQSAQTDLETRSHLVHGVHRKAVGHLLGEGLQ